ncbi:MAG: ATP-dependent DNA helicase RecG [bacterium]|nr:ATP-dependent DNA helicase RecG [bacterium]
MRPEILYRLFEPVTAISRVGHRTASLISSLAGPRIVDLIWHLPTSIINRQQLSDLESATPGSQVSVHVTVERHRRPGTPRHPWRIVTTDDAGRKLDLVYFRARESWLTKLLPAGSRRLVSGRIEQFADRLEMVHPDHVAAPGDSDSLPHLEPVYSLVDGLGAPTMQRIISLALERNPELPEWQDRAWLEQNGWPSWSDAVRRIHHPRDLDELAGDPGARDRLAFDELLGDQLALALVRARRRSTPGRSLRGDGSLRTKITHALPFRMTQAQVNAIRDISLDMEAPFPMLRLLQGDVGSGKTLVAVQAMLAAVEAGHQAALLAPTDLLARQHRRTIADLTRDTGIDVVLVTGRDRGAKRSASLRGVANGTSHLVVGTHALLSEGTEFHDLALIVVDEQHRFGVHQRIALAAKGHSVDTLVMTATPIPRTLQMTDYGGLDVTRLDERLPGRQEVTTRAMPTGRLDEVVAALGRAIGRGGRAYWICPVIERSESDDTVSAEDRYRHLSRVFGELAGLVHGRMSAADKDEVMERFTSGAIAVLVATTAVEVGLDVGAATIMVIEQAERFGLAQLHQLRGRVGRGNTPSSCLLLYAPPLNESARRRLDILRHSNDGFEIAEEDLRLRGGGELLGARQSGLPRFRLADQHAATRLLQAAHDDARLIVARDPDLKSERGRALTILLHLFERQDAIRLLASG